MLRLRMGTALTSLTVAGLLQGCISPLNQLESDVQVERSIRAHWRVPDRSPQNVLASSLDASTVAHAIKAMTYRSFTCCACAWVPP